MQIEKEMNDGKGDIIIYIYIFIQHFGFTQRRLEHEAVYIQMEQEALWQLTQLGE